MIQRLIIISMLLFAGCSLSEDELWLKVEHAKENANWDSTLTVSRLLLEEYPQGRFAGWARFAIAESHRFKNQPREALNNYKLFIETYPDLQPAPVSLFLVGYLYHNNLQNVDSARFYFERFLEKYPTHELAPSVRLEVEMLGKSPQEALNERIAAQRPLAKN
jgi:tetratricopeptide (TPR) repeat protein